MARNEVERGPGGGLRGDGGGGLWRYEGWETLGSQTPTETDRMCGRQTASGAWAGTAHDKAASKDIGDINEMRVPSGAVDDGRRGMCAGKANSLACHKEGELGGILCASSRDGCFLDARKVAGGIPPAGDLEE